MRLPQRLGVLILALIVATGTVGYVLIEDADPVDALYMTITTLTTVGYGEIFPLSRGGRIFTMVLILTGVGTALYLLSTLAEDLVEGRLRAFLGRNTMQRRIDQLEDHVVVCGYGRFGRVVADELTRRDVPVVIIDHDPAKEADLVRADLPYLIGSALADDVLERAGVRRARALVAGTAADPDNVFVTLSAREKNPRIRIHARGESDSGLRRLKLAGADHVISAYHMGGTRLAASILRPNVVDFLELASPTRGEEVAIEELTIPPACPFVSCTVRAVEQEGGRLRVVGLKRGEEALRLIPDPDTALAPGDLLLVIGDRESVTQLAARAQPTRSG
ncbi:MAG: potassium channel protein [Candidatus Binatia bacterium]